ncbi:hypothetical protein KL925_002212 [Ogataea polymorpha]|nr:hypothetical protein KL925_002212 [Ogataea polymorpha]
MAPIKRRTFTGCDTCRNRKVKCDGRRPQCLRCQKANVECLGYGIRLRFYEYLIAGPRGLEVSGGGPVVQHQRRHVPFMTFRNGYLFPEDMDSDLDKIDNSEEKFIGPFGVFRLNKEDRVERPAFVAAPSSFVAPTFETIIPRELWLHPRLQVDALLTYRTMIGDAMVSTNDWEMVKREIFTDYYGNTPCNRLVDRIMLSDSEMEAVTERYLKKLVWELGPQNTDDVFLDFLEHPKTRSWIQQFPRQCTSLMFVAYKGSILDKLVVPTLLRDVGELVVQKARKSGHNNVFYLLKQTFVLQSLAISTLGRYQALFDISGEHESSMSLLRSFIYLREASLANLSRVLSPLVSMKGERPEVTNDELLDTMLHNGIIDQLLMVIVMAIKLDESMSIFHNYKFLYGVASGIGKLLETRELESSTKDLMLWLRYLNMLFKSTSIIDIENYHLEEEKLDLKEVALPMEDPTKIEIKQLVVEESWEQLQLSNVPRRLAQRPPVEDKPPRKYVVQFTYGEQMESEDDEANEHENEGEPIRFSFPIADLPFSPIELNFGIPRSLLELMERTVELSDHRNYILRKKVYPRNFPKQCCDLEEDLRNWKLPWVLYEQRDGVLYFYSPLHESVYHLTVCFYYTTLMFFYRIIKESHPNQLQSHVASTLYHLEALWNLKLRVRRTADLRVNLPFWCFFLSGSDALDEELQTRYDILGRTAFDAGDRWIGKQALFEIWRGRNSNDDELRVASWLDLVKYWHIGGYM